MSDPESDVLRLAVESLRRVFPGKSRFWVMRALRRLPRVRQVRENVWVVDGDPGLGDRYPTYVVRYDPREGKYHCTCHETPWGLRRKAEICTHIAAVMLFRRYEALMEDVYAAVLHRQCTDYYLEIPSEYRGRVRIEKAVRVIGGDRFNPRHDVIYILWSREPLTMQIRFACDGEVEETNITMSRTKRYIIELLMQR